MNELERIDDYNLAFEQALQSGDADACARLCAENAILMPPEEPPVKGSEAIRNHFAGLGADSSVNGSVLELNISGDLAYQHSRVSWGSGDDARYTDSLDVLQKQTDGRWLLLASAWNTSTGFKQSD